MKARFPSTPFLDALKILDPREWKKNCEIYTNSGIIYHVDSLNELIKLEHKIKLKPEFLRICKVLEKQFAPTLISNTTIESEFIDFLNKRYKNVRNMDETEFLKYILNVRSDIYPNFIKFSNHFIQIANLYKLCQVLRFFQVQVLSVKEAFQISIILKARIVIVLKVTILDTSCVFHLSKYQLKS